MKKQRPHGYALILLLSLVLTGCSFVHKHPTVSLASRPSKDSGYIMGMFSGSQSFAFVLTNVSTNQEYHISFFQDLTWKDPENSLSLFELPIGDYNITHWLYFDPLMGGRIELKKEYKKPILIQVRAGKILFIGKFKALDHRTGYTEVTREIKPISVSNSEIIKSFLSTYPNFSADSLIF